MPGRDLSNALIKTRKFESANTLENAALVGGSAEDTAALPGGANAAGFCGFAMAAGGAGDYREVHEDGGIAIAIAAAAFAKDADLVIAGNTGKVKAASPTEGNVIAVAQKAAAADGDRVPVIIKRAKQPATDSFMPGHFAGVAAAGPVALVGAKVGDTVLMLTNITDAVNGAGSFEAAITVADQIQQTQAADLSTKKYSVLLVRKP